MDGRAAWELARAALPDVHVPLDAFESYLSRKTLPWAAESTHRSPPDPGTIVTDMYLACACSRGDVVAIAAFERRYANIIEGVRRRFGHRAPPAAELWSDLAERLFVPSARGPAKIDGYAGKSELSAWLRIVVMRVLLNGLDAKRPEDAFEERILSGLLVTEASPEALFGHAQHKAIVVRAFKRALAELPVRQKRLLRMSFAEGFTIDDVGSLHDVHRATAARWIKDAVEQLGAHVRRIVRAELGLSAEAYDRWASELTVSLGMSLGRVLETAPGT